MKKDDRLSFAKVSETLRQWLADPALLDQVADRIQARYEADPIRWAGGETIDELLASPPDDTRTPSSFD